MLGRHGPAQQGTGRLDGVTSSGLRPRWIAALGALVGALLISTASPASAHDELLGTDPAAGATVAALPSEVVLTFSGVLLTGDGATQVVVTDAAGADLTAGDPVVDGVRVTQPLTGDASGAVQVAWRVVSSDGHPISGQFVFSVGESASTTPATTSPTPTAPAPAAQAAADDLTAVWVAVGIVVIVGGLIGLLLARRRPPRED